MKFIPRTLALAALASASAFAQSAGGYDLHWNLPGAGGARMSGGNYVVTGSVGQAVASSRPLAGGDYALRGGFWAMTVPAPTGPDKIFKDGFDP